MNLHDFKDIHAHLAPGATDAPPGVLVSLTPEEARRVLRNPDLLGHFSVGVHPWHTDIPVNWSELEEMLRHPAVVAVGECGLDRLRGASRPVQLEVFRRQAQLAEQLGKPVILHVVKGIDDILAIRRELRPAQEWILHGFRGNVQQASQLVRAGLSLSLGRLYNEEALAAIPPERLFRESDAPVSEL